MEISWRHDLDKALEDARALRKPVLLDFSAAPTSGGCARLEAEVWPDERVARLVMECFVPTRLHVKRHEAEFERFEARYSVPWTPTTLFIDPEGLERHRIEGFLPVEDFLAQLTLGLGHLDFHGGRFGDAERHFRDVVSRFPSTESAPEGQYWAGVSKYKGTGDAAALAETARAFEERYERTSWAKKASVWRSSNVAADGHDDPR